MIQAQIIADSISPEGVRLSTAQVCKQRFMLSELNTHRTLSRNSASSRAIPVSKQIARIEEDLAFPVSWPREQKGMQGGDEIPAEQVEIVEEVWRQAAGDAIAAARRLTSGEFRVHKSVVNRLLEPFMWHTVVITATAWQNFFDLRIDEDAQAEIRTAAMAIKTAYDASTPTLLEPGQWHLPYVGAQYQDQPLESQPMDVWLRVSAARCARTSYLTQDGQHSIEADLTLWDRLITERSEIGKPLHWSPLEHVATPWAANRQSDPLTFVPASGGSPLTVTTGHLPRVGNLLGWRSLRTEIEASQSARTYR